MKKIDLKYCTRCSHSLERREIQGNERMVCPHCDTVYYDNPVPSVAVVVQNERGQLLLIKRKVEPKKGFWALPGGFIDDGESAIQCALRELEEETGLKGIVKRFIQIYNHESEMYGFVIIIVYEVDIIGGRLQAGDDAEFAEFFEIDELPQLAFPFHKKAVEKVVGCSLSKTNERVRGMD